MRRGVSWIVTVGLTALSHPLLAAETNLLTNTPSLNGPSITASLLRMVGGLIFIFALLFGALWLSRNSRRFMRSAGAAPKLLVLESRSLGQRQTLFVVAYEQQRLLLSSSQAGISLLTHLPSADPSDAPAAPATPSFAEVLIQTVSRKP